jgi:Zn-dependent protease
MKALLLLFKGAKLGKVALTGGTMLLSVFAYGLIWGWPYAVGFVGLILVHELGHFIAARQRGLDVGAPTFIPFVGAWIQLKDQPHNAETEAYIGLAGPVAGTAAALACFEMGRLGHQPLLLALAYAGFIINLFNLLPISPLDGGRITAVISPRLWLLGAPMLVGLFFWHPSPMFLLIAILAWPNLVRAFKGEGHDDPYYASVPAATRLQYGVFYLGLAAYLAAMSYSLHEELGSGGTALGG